MLNLFWGKLGTYDRNHKDTETQRQSGSRLRICFNPAPLCLCVSVSLWFFLSFVVDGGSLLCSEKTRDKCFSSSRQNGRSCSVDGNRLHSEPFGDVSSSKTRWKRVQPSALSYDLAGRVFSQDRYSIAGRRYFRAVG